MYGDRARIGIIGPAAAPPMEYDAHRFAPAGVTFATTRILFPSVSLDSLKQMTDGVGKAAEIFAYDKPDAIVFACTTGSMVGGLDYDKCLSDLITEISGVKAITTTEACKIAFEIFNAKKLALFTPYPKELNEMEARFLKGSGYEISQINGLDLKKNEEYSRVEPGKICDFVLENLNTTCDAIFISCCGLWATDVINKLESITKIPVVTSIQATIWGGLRLAGIEDVIDSFGKLGQIRKLK